MKTTVVNKRYEDVIALPKVKDASCLMTEAPTRVEQKQLDELAIAIVETEE